MIEPHTCLVLGVSVSFMVHAIKGWKPVSRYPQLAAGILSTGSAIVAGVASGDNHSVSQIAVCAALQFGVAIGTHEAITKRAFGSRNAAPSDDRSTSPEVRDAD